ncbi:MAG: hypothetical protein KIS62_01475 [Ramlibacter sp.]|nr:hypothetical protein [Ramlibacter sp.]
MITPWLTDSEADDLCAPLTQNCAKVKYLRGLGLEVRTKPNGRPLVLRSNVEAVLGGSALPGSAQTATARQPNVTGLILQFGRKGA